MIDDLQAPQLQLRWLQSLRGPRFPRAEIWLALFTGVLVIETGISLRLLSTSDEALNRAAEAADKSATISDRLREITEETDRAWVGPTNAAIDGSVEIDKPIKVSIDYANSGKRPAVLNIISGIEVISLGDWRNVFTDADIWSWESRCITRVFVENDRDLSIRVAYPSTGTSTYAIHMVSDEANEIAKRFILDQPFINGDKITPFAWLFRLQGI
jgi:hypothetical protein